jgi:hypothetical protein
MPSSTVPPVPKSGSGGYIAVAAVMLVAMGGLIFWKLNSGEPEVVETTPAPARTEEAAVVLDVAPPPPPPVEELEEETAKPEEKKVAVASSGNSGCSGTCNGTLSAEGMGALRTKGGQARGCYNRALRQDSTLAGKMSLQVRISPSGNVCSVQVTEDTLGDSAVTTCVTQMFRAGKFPPPEGGCVDASVPLNFVAQR